MPELVTITRQRAPVPSWPARVWRSVRATWSGPWSAKDPALANLFSDGSRSSAGITVTPEVAFTYSAVYDAVNQIASDVAKMPLNLMKRLPNGGSTPYVDSKLYRLLKYKPNPEMGSMVFRRQLTAWALCSHGGYAEIVRDTLGRPAELWPIEPHRVTVKRGNRDELVYEIDGGATIIPAEDMIHLRGLGYTPHEPYGIINKARQAIGLALAAERFGATFFGNGSTFGGLLTTDTSLSPEEAKALKEAVEGIHKGPDRAHALAVLWGGVKYQKLGVAPNEAQMNELRDKQAEEVARFFRMQPYRLGVNKPGSVSYASVEQANIDHATGCLLDWTTLWEEELNCKLIPSMEFKLQYVKHNMNVFLRADFEKRMAGYATALDKGLYSRNEVRELEEMGPQDGEQGNWYLVQSAQVPLHMLKEVTEASIAPPEPPSPPVTPTEPETNDDEDRQAILEAITAMETKIAEALAARAEAESRADAAQAAHFTERAESMASTVAALQVQLEAATAASTVAVSEAEAERSARLVVEAQRDTLHREAEATRQSLVEAEARASARQAELAAAEAARDAQVRVADDAIQALAVIQARLDAATGDEARAVIEAERQVAQALVDQAEQSAQLARDDSDAARVEADLARAAVDAAEARAIDAAAARVESEARLAAVIAESEAESVMGREQLAAATDRASALEAQAEALQAQAAEQVRAAEQALADARHAIKTRDASLLAASRGLVVEAMGVLVRRETAQARSKQATPQKLRTWLAGMAVLHEPVCVERLTGPVRLHLALTNRTEDAEQVAAQMAAVHLAEFRRQVEAVLEVDVDEFHVALERMLTRWESERPSAVADALLVEGIRHVA